MMLNLGRGMSRKKFSTANSDPSLKSVVSSCVFDLDATKAASYPGSGQTWANLVPSPADGSAQTAYDFSLGATTGASTDDPSFSGSAGSSAAYFTLDGGDFFKTASNTSFLNALHKTTGGTAFWLAIAFRYVDSGSLQEVFSTRSSATPGMNIRIGSGDTPGAQQRGDSASVSSSAVATIADATNSVVIVSYNAGALRYWTNSATKETASITPNSTSANANSAARIGCGGTGGSFMPNGTRIYAVSMGNAFIDNTEAAAIIQAYNTRHGRTYA